MEPALDSLDPATLRDWTPVWVAAKAGEPVVEWARIDGRFTDPFFEQTATRAMDHAFNLVFSRVTPLAALAALRANAPGLAPTGFIFHMSRCGSTLIAQMLTQMTSAIVLSEPQPLDALLRMRRHGVDDEMLIGWLRGMMSALAQPRAGERRLFVKFHAWHVLELPLIARAFPGVPWIFVFREPCAVLLSQAKAPGAEVVLGMIDPAYLGLDFATGYRVPPDEYGARVIAALCDAALRYAGLGRSAFLEYDSLPESVLSGPLLDFFGVRAGAEDLRRMREVARFDAKSTGTTFRASAGARDPSGEIERLAAVALDAAYAAMYAAATR